MRFVSHTALSHNFAILNLKRKKKSQNKMQTKIYKKEIIIHLNNLNSFKFYMALDDISSVKLKQSSGQFCQ